MNNTKRISSFSDSFLSHRRKVFAGFGLGVATSLLTVSLFFFLSSNSVPKIEHVSVPPFYDSYYSLPCNNHFHTSNNNVSHQHETSTLAIVAVHVNNNTTLSLNSTTNNENGNNNATLHAHGEGVISSEIGAGNSSRNLHDGGIRIVTNYSSVSGEVKNNGTQMNVSGIIDENCNIFDGKWVKDDSKPYYPLGSCPLIDRDFDCHRNGRPDSHYVKWKWKPNGCHIPSLNASDFLERLRGQRLVFVGDSLNRNMWESLVCILRQSINNKKRVFEISGKTEFKKKVDFVMSPFIVQESTFKGKNGTFETLRLDLMDQTTKRYKDADIIVFNTGHWWTHEKTSKGEDYYQEGNHVYPRLKALDAYKRALTTWAKWIDQHINPNQTRVFFRGYSVTHFWGGQWNSGGQCHKESEPILNETYLQKYPSKMRAVEYVIHNMKTPVVYMNISRLTDYRKDGHPSIYRKDYKPSTTATLFEDCSHWCLPGVPDTWNELLYVSLLKHGRETWKS
ncbi:Transducin beta-like protein 2 [Stylosanthes scabra]|uniref:Transducin beta-like protein 2 n=1 Tax=Stylosanthes scabra TaxID=79078 RepID=A0ABU6W5K1_9FABA|nr:Transducin beta-like protein 2 [Stylosanthes scabra]